MFYRNLSEITIDKEFYGEIKRVFPDANIKEKGNKIIILDDKKKDLADFCEGIANKHKKKAEINSKGELIITLESFGQMSVENIFKKSVETLKKDFSSLAKEIGKIK